jgi:hypothetical protein
MTSQVHLNHGQTMRRVSHKSDQLLAISVACPKAHALGRASNLNLMVPCTGNFDPAHPVASHFTQVVWKSTKQVGCALTEGCSGIFDPKFGVCSVIISVDAL